MKRAEDFVKFALTDGFKTAKDHGPIFDRLGEIQGLNSCIVGEQDDILYLIYIGESQDKIIGPISFYQDYKSDDFVWIKYTRDKSDLRGTEMNSIGSFIVHLPTNKFFECPKPPTMIDRNCFETGGGEKIVWKNGDFRYDCNDNNENKKLQNEDIKDMRADELENYISENTDIKFSRGTPDNMDIVDNTRPPIPMVEIFYQLGEGEFPQNEDGDFKPPDQGEFANHAYYIFKNNSTNDEAFREETKRAWMKRLRRTWSSVVRDVHFSFMMYEEQNSSNSFDNISFDIEQDVNDGIDFLIEDNSRKYEINLFVDTSNSRKFLNKKKDHRHDNNDSVEVSVPMKPDGVKKTVSTQGRDLWLYSDEHIEGVKKLIKEDKDEIRSDDGQLICKKLR